MSKKNLTRREVLQGLGSAALYLPFMESLWIPRAYGQTSGRPLRIVFIGSTNGQKQNVFFPGDSVALTQTAPNILTKKLSDISGDISQVFGPSWNALRNKVSIVRGLDAITSAPNHNRGAFLASVMRSVGDEGSGPKFGASVDWILEQSANFYKTAPAIKALRHNALYFEFSYSNIGGKVAALPYISTDTGLFNQAFASLNGGGGGGGSTIPAMRGLAADKVMERLRNLESNVRLSVSDRQRITDHNSRLAGLKTTYTPVAAPLACAKPAQSKEETKRRIYNNVNDTIVSAFNCDLTRIACYSLEDYDDTKTDYQYQHDQVSHNNSAADIAASIVMNKWKADRVVDLITKLDSVQDGDGTLLDNTLVVWGNETGASIIPHAQQSMPVVIAGGKNIKFNFGYYVDYRTRPFRKYAGRDDFPYAGRPYNQFLASVMLAMGLQRSEFEIFGEKGKFGEYSTTEYSNGFYKEYDATYTDKLPFLYLG